MQNKYPLWKNLLLVGLVVIGLVYALPNLFHDDPAVQISTKDQVIDFAQTTQSVKDILQNQKINYSTIEQAKDTLVVRFVDTDTQLKARDIISSALGEDKYSVALNLAPRTPKWLQMLNAQPMKLGLDLRGGVNFLLDVDAQELLKAHEDGDMRAMGDALREANIRYRGLGSTVNPAGIVINFNDQTILHQALSQLTDRFRDYQFTENPNNNSLQAIMLLPALTKINNYAIDQAMNILRNRVNALGVSEALVQRQGRDRISVELPGIQDVSRARNIIGKVATLKFQMVDMDHDTQSALAGDVPLGSKLYTYENHPVLLKEQVILHGNAITFATAAFGQDGRPSVNVRLSGSDEISQFNRATGDNIGKRMAIVYVETKSDQQMIDGKETTVHHQIEQVISVATIQSALGNDFEITGLESPKYAQDLALLLRSGALIAPINIIQERTIGPSLGVDNIHKGTISVVIGFIAVVIFMAIYYQVFGLIADLALFLNLIFIVAIFSMLGVTMTLPGIAAMVLTVGMAVDANVLIYERIREELRNGISPQASIYVGYDRAFTTIVDANVTTLIVALILFALGSGPVKGFAVTLIIGILASMTTAIVFTRAIVNLIYGSRNTKKLSIGI